MHLTELHINQFRCHAGVRMTIPDAGVRIVGPNGSGKTSLLEAIAMLATTRSFRGAQDRDVVRWESGADYGVTPFARIEAQVESRGEQRALAIAMELDVETGAIASKRFLVDDRATSAHELVGNLRVVAFTPEDVQLVIGPPADRRRALDILISQFDRAYMRHLSAYGRVLRQRNGLLKAFARDRVRADAPAAMTQLSFWDEQLVGEGAYLVARRARVVAELGGAMDRHAADLSSRSRFSVAYESRVDVDAQALAADAAPGDALTRAAAAFQADLHTRRDEEFRRGLSLTGPHRDDVVFSIDGRSLARFGSRGQQRLGVLALKLAEADVIASESHDTPVFLLDDVLSELDAGHRRLLLDELAKRHAQIVMTSAEDDALDHAALGDLAVFRTGT